MWHFRQAMALCPLLICAVFAVPARAAPDPVAATASCIPGGACAHPLEVRAVIVTMFEVGADTGDAPGEFQLWKERRHLDARIPFPQAYHDLWYNPETRVLGMVTGMGSIKSATSVLALGLDQRFDLRRAYWLVAGIGGVDPADASVGSAVWAHYLVDGDMAHEIDPREIPKDWKYGYFPVHSKGPNDPAPAEAVNGEMMELSPSLQDWAFRLTRDIALPDNPGLVASRAPYAGFPNAQRPPFVLEGDNVAAMTYWHGKLMTDWANDWVKHWTHGKGEFVTSAMEDTGTFQSLIYLDRIHRADTARVMMLRTASNYTMPPPGVTAAAYLLRENQGYSAMRGALESAYLVGSKVLDALLADWPKYEKAPPR
jgi:purine nucleoside permease